ncbi:MAG: cupin domain-containing protein [Pseudomonadales bacterium]|nr:cupin domain-containing protein [Pseudomonadales bacterium]
MQINMDRSRRIVINTARAAWVRSPAKGVWRKPLEREAAESGQVTSIVRYDSGSEFVPHGHPAGEEIFVISGVFEDEYGVYPAGSYFRNPPGSSHTPRSSEGCVLWVKLNRFPADDAQSLNINTRSHAWSAGLVEGLAVKPLHSFGAENTALVQWQPGSKFVNHVHHGGEEIFVLEGVFEDEYGSYPKGSWIRSPPHSQHSPFSHEGCTILVKTGHMIK